MKGDLRFGLFLSGVMALASSPKLMPLLKSGDGAAPDGSNHALALNNVGAQSSGNSLFEIKPPVLTPPGNSASGIPSKPQGLTSLLPEGYKPNNKPADLKPKAEEKSNSFAFSLPGLDFKPEPTKAPTASKSDLMAINAPKFDLPKSTAPTIAEPKSALAKSDAPAFSFGSLGLDKLLADEKSATDKIDASIPEPSKLSLGKTDAPKADAVENLKKETKDLFSGLMPKASAPVVKPITGPADPIVDARDAQRSTTELLNSSKPPLTPPNPLTLPGKDPVVKPRLPVEPQTVGAKEPSSTGLGVVKHERTLGPVNPYFQRFLDRKEYYIREGDTLESIAHNLYQDETMVGTIQRLNEETLRSNRGVRPGMLLRLP